MEPGKHPINPVRPRRSVEEQLQVLHRELAAREAEIKALRETLDLVYTKWMQRDEQIQTHLRHLQAQVDALDTGASSGQALTTNTPPTSVASDPVAYGKLVTRIQNLVGHAIPAEATVLVISRGDDALVQLDGRRGWHFPQRDDGVYAGYHPADSAEAIAHLEKLRDKGADYLVIPNTSLWWLNHYKAFTQYLKTRCNITVQRNDTCWIVDLNPATASGKAPPAALTAEERAYQTMTEQIEALVAALLPADAVPLVISKGDEALLQRCGDNAHHFPQDADGAYPGYYPADSAAVIGHLEKLRSEGADYLIIPRTAFWWLDYYQAFGDHLERHYPVVCRQQNVCLIFSLTRRSSDNA